MSGTSESDIIDLTNSFTLANHCGLSDIVIDLDTDDSLCLETESLTDSIHYACAQVKDIKPKKRPTSTDIAKEKITKPKKNAASPISKKKNKFGCCPICLDEFGNQPLASTKCGHVYCIHCLEEYLKLKKKCPTCRKSLKGSSAYHPLYLSRE